MVIRTLVRISHGSQQHELYLVGTRGLYTLGHGPTYRSGSCVSQTRGCTFFNKRGPGRVYGVLYNSNHRGTYEAHAIGGCLLNNALTATHDRRGHFYHGCQGTTSTSNVRHGTSITIFICFHSGHRNTMFSVTFMRLVLGPLNMFQAKRLLTRIVGTRAIIGTLLRCSSRPYLSFGGRGLNAIVIDTCHHHGSNEATTSGRCIVIAYHRRSSPPSFAFISPCIVATSTRSFLASCDKAPEGSTVVLIADNRRGPP